MAKIPPIDRRQLIQYGGAFIGTSLMATILGNNLANAPAVNAQSVEVNPDTALDKLMAGNARFLEEKRIKGNQGQVRLLEIAQAQGQTPFAAILGCADSRIPPEIVFDQGLGELFVCRIAGNIASPQEIGSLEFGAVVLGAKVIMVLGHQSCGAVKAAMDGGELPGQIGSVVKKIDIGKVTGNSDDPLSVEAATKANVLHQVEVLKQSPLVTELIDQDKLKVVGAYYSLDSGKVTLL